MSASGISGQGVVVWLTGLSGAGKSTLARGLAGCLRADGFGVRLLDGDELRATVCRDLGFSLSDRREHVLRVGRMADELASRGMIVIAALISPLRSDREELRTRIGWDRFIEVYVNAPLEVCEQRDPKGLYAKARAGLIREFTGIESPYEAPLKPDLEVRTDWNSPEACVRVLRWWLARRGSALNTRVPKSSEDPVPSVGVG